MSEKVKDLAEKGKAIVGKISKKTWIILGAALVALIAVAIAVVVALNNQPYAVLFTNLNREEASSIMAYLEENGATDYRLENNDTILVPESQEPILKAKLSMEGYPKNGFSYSTYYDHVSSLSTESERDNAYLMLLQERMGAVVRCFEGVKDAAVTITPGENRSFVLDSNNVVKASASVFVTMQEGEKLTNEQAAAIRNLVARSVQGLDIDSVAISDSLGNQYSADAASESTDASDLKFRLEEEVNNKVRTEVMKTLIPFFGEDNVRVSVNSTVDVNRTIGESTTYTEPEWAADGSTNGEGIIGSKVYDNAIVRAGEEPVGGVVGTEENADLSTYVENEAQPNGTEQEIRTSGQIDYKTDTRVEHVERTAGIVTDCMVSVSINSTTAGSVDVESLRTHVARAAGITDEDAASKISVLSMAFYNPVVAPPVVPGSDVPMWAVFAAGGGLLLFLVVLMIILLIRRRRRKKKLLAQQQQELAANEFLASVGMPQEVPAGADVMSLQTEKSMELRKDIRQFAEENPEIAAQMVKSWLKGGDDHG